MTPTKPFRTALASTQSGKLSAAGYASLQAFIQAESGIVIEADKQYMLESRLVPLLDSPIAKSFGLRTLEQLSHLLKSRSPADLTMLVLDAITTNETFFFRDEPLFEALRTHLLPPMLAALNGARKLRIWSAASSSGQEAYSIAMLLCEMGADPNAVEIVGTDISTQVLERAREGRYTQAEINRGLPPDLLARYFGRSGAEWQISDEIRAMVTFGPIDLRRNIARLGKFDIILCRNVLIYFDTETKKKILGALRPMLWPTGILVLGCAETIINLTADLHRDQIGSAAFYTPLPGRRVQ